MRWQKRATETERSVTRVAIWLSVLAFVVFVAMCEMARAEPIGDRTLIENAARCGVDPFVASELLHVESLSGLDVPRGMLLAKACFESRGNPHAVGDNGQAVGLLQLWPWADKWTDRRDPVGSGVTFLGAIGEAMKRTRRHCPGAKRLFVLTWIRVNRGPFWRREDRRGEPRCSGADPAGLRVLRRWGGGAS